MSLYKFRFKYKLFRSNSPEHVTSGVETMMLLLSMLSISFQKEYILQQVKIWMAWQGNKNGWGYNIISEKEKYLFCLEKYNWKLWMEKKIFSVWFDTKNKSFLSRIISSELKDPHSSLKKGTNHVLYTLKICKVTSTKSNR